MSQQQTRRVDSEHGTIVSIRRICHHQPTGIDRPRYRLGCSNDSHPRLHKTCQPICMDELPESLAERVQSRELAGAIVLCLCPTRMGVSALNIQHHISENLMPYIIRLKRPIEGSKETRPTASSTSGKRKRRGKDGYWLYAALDIQVLPYNGQMCCALERISKAALKKPVKAAVHQTNPG